MAEVGRAGLGWARRSRVAAAERSEPVSPASRFYPPPMVSALPPPRQGLSGQVWDRGKSLQH